LASAAGSGGHLPPRGEATSSPKVPRRTSYQSIGVGAARTIARESIEFIRVGKNEPPLQAARVRPNPSLERTSTGKALGPQGSRLILRLAAQAPFRLRPLSSNVRPRSAQSHASPTSFEPSALEGKKVERRAAARRWRSTPRTAPMAPLLWVASFGAKGATRMASRILSVGPAPPEGWRTRPAPCRRRRRSHLCNSLHRTVSHQTEA
jgi:hypothetical protein